MLIGFGTAFWGNAIFNLPQNFVMVDAEFLPYYIKMLPVFFSILGACLAFILNNYFSEAVYNFTKKYSYLYTFLNKKWYFDNIYNKYIVNSFLFFGYHISFKTIDRGFIEIFGPLNIVRIIDKLVINFNKIQTGYLYHYAFLMVLGATSFVLLIFQPFIIFNIDYHLYILFIISIFLLLNNDKTE